MILPTLPVAVTKVTCDIAHTAEMSTKQLTDMKCRHIAKSIRLLPKMRRGSWRYAQMYGTLGLFLEPKRDISKRDERDREI